MNAFQKLRDKGGYGLVELMLVMLLLCLFGVTLFTLVLSGTKTYQKITDNKNAEAEARVAMNYLVVRLRQCDARDCIRVLPDTPANGHSALVMRDPAYDDDVLTWLIFEEGKLFEVPIKAGRRPDAELGYEIASLKDLQFAFDAQANAVTITIEYDIGGEPQQLTGTVTLRSAPL